MRTFENRHPLALFLYFTSVLVITMFVSNPVIHIISLICGLAVCISGLKRGRHLARDFVFLFLLFIIITLSNPLFSHNGVTQLFFFNDLPITAEALFYGASLAATVTAVLLWFKYVTSVMTSDKLLYLFSGISPGLALTFSMSLRYVPLFRRRSGKIRRAQKALGCSPSGAFSKVKSAMRVFTSLIGISLESAMDTSASMKARGYGLKGRTSFSLFRFRKDDAVMISFTVLLVSAIIYGAASGSTAFYFYPEARFADITAVSYVSYVSFAFLALIPLI